MVRHFTSKSMQLQSTFLKTLIMVPNNIFLNEGIKKFLSEIFRVHFKTQLEFFTQYEMENISTFDLIILHLEAGESYRCHHILQHRRDDTLVVGFSAPSDPPLHFTHPLCFSDASLCTYNQSLKEIKDTVIHGWSMAVNKRSFAACTNCNNCQKTELTDIQKLIVTHIFYELDYAEISKRLGIENKRISAHVIEIMRKFNLRTKVDFISFVNHICTSSISRSKHCLNAS